MKAPYFLPCLLAVALGCGCGSSSSVALKKSTTNAPADAWSVTTLDPNDPMPAYLSNGLMGIRLGRDGTGNGQPFFATEEYLTSGEEKIRILRNPVEQEISIAGQPISPERGTEYRQSLDFRKGILTTAWMQHLPGGVCQIVTRTVLHSSALGIAQQWKLVVPPGSTARIKMAGFAEGGFRHDRLTSDLSNVGFAFGSKGKVGYHVARLLGGWDGVWSHQRGEVEWNGRLLGPKELTLEREFMAHPPSMRAFPIWRPWKDNGSQIHLPDLEIDGPVEDQQAIRSFLFYLRNSVHPNGGMSVAPMGLSNKQYNGHVFWDADIWMFPVLALVDPESARTIPRYRIEHKGKAIQNFGKWCAEGRPVHSRNLGVVQFPFLKGMMFPWESSVSGKETQPGESKFQHHVSGSVAFALEQAASLDLADSAEARKILDGVAHSYRWRMEINPDGTKSINDTMSPDENGFVDNDLYTNLVAQWCFNGGTFSKTNPEIKLKLPKDDRTFLTYDGDRVVSYKQAAAVLSIYPLQYPEAEKQARAMMERFEPRVPFNGPAMTDSIHALIWARLGEKEKAYKEWRESWKEFTNHPLMLFSEKRVPSETYFVTGAAGCLQTVIYGFLGFRIDVKPQPGAAWSIPLKNGRFLSIKPNLPPAWKSVRFKNFHVLGKRYTLEATHSSLKVTPSS